MPGYDRKAWAEMKLRLFSLKGKAVNTNRDPSRAPVAKELPLAVKAAVGVEDTPADSPSISSFRGKRCAKCLRKKAFEEFPKHTGSSDGMGSYCKKCKNDLAKLRRQKDPVARIKHYTVTRIQNEWPKEKIPQDLYPNLEHYLGYSLIALKTALKKDLRDREGITVVEAFKRDYHLDHKVPHSSFKPEEIGDIEFKKCWSIDNLWLIPAQTNLKKGAKQDYFVNTEGLYASDEIDDETVEELEEELEHAE